MATKSKKTAKKPSKPAAKKAVKKTVKKAAPKAKKPAPKKPAAKKPAPKKAAPKAKKPAPKKAVAKKPAPKKAVAKKAPEKKVEKHIEHKPAQKHVVESTTVKKHAVNLVAQPRAHKSEDNRHRYSDKELLEFKNLIDEKLEAARNELKYLNDQINRKDDNGTDDTENKFGSIEDGSVAMEREYLTQMASRQAAYIDHLDKALLRIQNKTYGICRVTGKLIDKERLRAVPHATLSIEAKMMQNK
ncbi:MAG: TraR/DksA C4-type zinc finger protein [Bacteroidota bacterium]